MQQSIVLAVLLIWMFGQGVFGQSPNLPGTNWELVYYTLENDGKHSVMRTAPITLAFSADNQEIFGSAGCNRYQAATIFADPALAITDPTKTRMECRADIMTQEKKFLFLLERSTQFERSDDRLLFTSTIGTLEFQPLKAEP